MLTKAFKALSETRQRIYVGRIKNYLDAGYDDEQILTMFPGLEESLVKEMIEMVKVAEVFKKVWESNK